MGKGTPSKGKKNKAASHKTCRRCGRHSFHRKKKVCASCGFGKTAKLRKPSWRNRHKAFQGNKGFYK
ncbi:MAG: 50S ribosomal protein L37e [Candidatus Lokiarchaeota archaeon]|nr:50S ribosomal protein L37e [Candidatus Lokiarchaeota archaeon]MBD3339892.1 50S ribosomal protein L37e [Candidatus Lokiarchaeota archaeon]